MRNENGAVLIVGMLILLVMTLIGLTATRSALFDIKVSDSVHSRSMVFNGAESAINETIADATVFEAALGAGSGSEPTRSFSLTADGTSHVLSASTRTFALAPKAAIGFSLGTFVAYPFEINASSEIASTGASAAHVQTVERVAPRL